MSELPLDQGALPAEVAEAVQRLDELVKEFEQHPERLIQERVFELLQCVDTLHRAGLRSLNELLKTAGLQRRAVEDPEVRLLFDLYDLGEGGERSRAEAVVESLRPGVEAAGGALELLAADSACVQVRLSHLAGDPHVDQLRAAVEHALQDGLPGVTGIEIIAETSAHVSMSNFVPLSGLVLRRPPEWQPALSLAELPVGALRGIDVGDTRVLLAHVDPGEVYAYRNQCPSTPFALDAAPIRDGILMCPWHGCRFELRGGRRVDAEAPGLGVLPVRIESERIMVGVSRVVKA